MNKIILMLMLLAHTAYAFGKPYVITTECIDGHKFLIVDDTYSISVVQMYEERSGFNGSVPKPIKCKDGK